MTLLQLIKQKQGLSPLPNPKGLEPVAIFRKEKNAFLAGSEDLVWIAFGLARYGKFRILAFKFVNRYFAPLDEDVNEVLSDNLIGLIDKGKAELLQEFIVDRLRGRFVEQVELHNETTRNNFTIAQQGVIHAQDEDYDSLTHALLEVNPLR